MAEPAFHLDVDIYINPYIPRSRLHLLPRPISWLLGHRTEAQYPLGSVLVWWWAFIGAFSSILIIEAVFRTETLRMEGTPMVIASLGAAAILEFNTIESPLAQPRNCLFGQTFAAVIGVGITKLFHLNQNFESIRWIAGALSVGICSAVMGLTKTIHPPAGATALLAATSNEITTLGWFLVPLIVLGSCLMLAVACIINNVHRQFPLYWWTPVDLSLPGRSDEQEGNMKSKDSITDGASSWSEYAPGQQVKIIVDDTQIVIPDWMELEPEEQMLLNNLQLRLQGFNRRST